MIVNKLKCFVNGSYPGIEFDLFINLVVERNI